MEKEQIVKNKVMAVRMAGKVSVLLRWVSTFLNCVLLLSWYSLTGNDADSLLVAITEKSQEKVSGLKPSSGSNKLPYGTLSLWVWRGRRSRRPVVATRMRMCTPYHPISTLLIDTVI
jgi:hypothetical protein